MREIKTVKVSATKAYTKKVEVVLCDICGKPDPRTSTYGQMTRCHLCNRDVHCHYDWKCSSPDPEEIGDYPAYYCTYCYELRFKKYSKLINDIQEKAYNDVEEIEQQIKEESLAWKKE